MKYLLVLMLALAGCGGQVTTGPSTMPDVTVDSFCGSVEKRYTSTTVNLNDTPEDVMFISLGVSYDPDILKFVQASDSQWIDSYGFKTTFYNYEYQGRQVQEITFNNPKGRYLPESSSGQLVTLIFEVLQDEVSFISLVPTVFDIKYPDWSKSGADFLEC